VIKAERRILNNLGFVVHVHHPHKLIYVYLHVLGLLRNNDNEILQKAWNYMNDGLRTDMFLRYTPATIACACIFLAVRTNKETVVLPKHPFPWFELFDVSDRDVKSVCSMLIDLYSIKKSPNFIKLSHEIELLYETFLDQQKPDIVDRTAEKREETNLTQNSNVLAKIVNKHNEKPIIDKAEVETKRKNEPSRIEKNDRKRSRSRESRHHRIIRSHGRSRSRSRDRHRRSYDREGFVLKHEDRVKRTKRAK